MLSLGDFIGFGCILLRPLPEYVVVPGRPEFSFKSADLTGAIPCLPPQWFPLPLGYSSNFLTGLARPVVIALLCSFGTNLRVLSLAPALSWRFQCL